MPYTENDFDFYEKLDSLECRCRFKGDQADASDCDRHQMPVSLEDAGDSPEVYQPDPCPVRHSIFLHGRTLGEIRDALDCHKVEYCEICGQLEGFVRLGRAA